MPAVVMVSVLQLTRVVVFLTNGMVKLATFQFVSVSMLRCQVFALDMVVVCLQILVHANLDGLVIIAKYQCAMVLMRRVLPCVRGAMERVIGQIPVHVIVATWVHSAKSPCAMESMPIALWCVLVKVLV